MTESLSRAQVENSLRAFIDPHTQTDLMTAQAVKSIHVDAGRIAVKIVLGYPAQSYMATLREALSQHLAALPGAQDIALEISWQIVAHSVQKTLKPLPSVKNIIAVASGKGGVGKSTTAVNLALALQTEGARAGLLDADIYGPSIPTMLGITGYPDSLDGKTMLPKVAYGVETNSIGFLIDDDQPMIWRGPMVTNALQQLLTQTRWNDLDYLIIDLPPGTGDIQLTLAQQIPVTAAVIITTPQDIALLDAQRGLKMFEKVNIPVLGLIENMSVYICRHCGHEEAIFGQGGGQAMAEKYGVELLGALPLDRHIREFADCGRPTVVAEPESRAAQLYLQIARRIAAKLALQAKDYSAKFPNIIVQNT